MSQDKDQHKSENSNSLKLIIDKLNGLPTGEMSQICYNKFVKLSHDLSCYLPKPSDRSLYEIDDLLYPNDKQNERAQTKDNIKNLTSKLIDDEFHEHYMSLFSDLIHNKYEMDRSVDNVILFIFQNVLNSLINQEIIEELITSRDIIKLCVGLKLLKILLMRDAFKIPKYYYSKVSGFSLTILRMQNLSTSSDGNEILQYASRMARDCFIKMESPYQVAQDRKISRLNPKDCIEKNVISFALSNKECHKSYEELYNLCDSFLSAKDDAEKDEFLKMIVKIINIRRKGRFVEDMDHEFKTIFDMLFKKIEKFKTKSQASDKDMLFIDEHFGQGIIDPYFSPKLIQIDDDVSVASTMTTNVECLELPDRADYLTQKFLVYDDFIKYLQLLTIFHAAAVNRDEFMKKKGIKLNVSSSFEYNKIYLFVEKRLLDETKRGKIPWHIEIALRRCPFIILKPDREHLVEDLIKLLKGDDVDASKVEIVYEDFFKKIREAVSPLLEETETL